MWVALAGWFDYFKHSCWDIPHGRWICPTPAAYHLATQTHRKGSAKARPDACYVAVLTNEPTYSGFMNGAIGTIRQPRPHGAWVAFDDGTEDAISGADLERLTRGWAISIHKAQGSAFRPVILPITPSRLLDRAMIYTAMTRAVETVVLIGDPDLISKALHPERSAESRGSNWIIS